MLVGKTQNVSIEIVGLSQIIHLTNILALVCIEHMELFSYLGERPGNMLCFVTSVLVALKLLSALVVGVFIGT